MNTQLDKVASGVDREPSTRLERAFQLAWLWRCSDADRGELTSVQD